MSNHVRPQQTSPCLFVARSVIGVVVAGIALTGCAADDPISSRGSTGATVELTIEDFDFGEPLAVPAGTTLEVINADGVGHTWTSTDGVFDSGFLLPDTSFEHVLAEVGTFSFLCTVHRQMTGAITVTP